MAKLNKTKRDELVDFVRKQINAQLELKKIQGKIFIEFGVVFSLRSICYYVDKAEQEKRIAKYEKENKLMRKWWGEDSSSSSDNLAELLFEAVSKCDEEANLKVKNLLN